MNLARAITTEPVILTEGALVERLRRDAAWPLDPNILHAGFVYQPAGRAALEKLYRQYLDIGREFDLPMIVCSPTWRANPERLRAAGFGKGDDVNGDGVRFVQSIRAAYGEYGKRVCVGGLIGCRGDAYDPRQALSTTDATAFHREQVSTLAAAHPDFLMVATLPAASEALGIAHAMARCATPYLLSFVIRADGTLLDGTPLDEAVVRIDADAHPSPVGYMVNCVHPTVFAEAMKEATSRRPGVGARLVGLQGNTSRRPPEELDGRAALDAERPQAFAEAMLTAHRRFGTVILGGCCGTEEAHVRAIAKLIRAEAR